MDYESKSKDELIAIIEKMKSQRAFTYEDRMKLAILDESPFTVWASDKDCKIRLWEGQSEALYGYTKAEVMGKDYVDLFVAEDERNAARIDQISIIDEGVKFHNIANDIGKYKNTLQLVTNCFRICDIETKEYWNAEMGLIIDYLDQEKAKLEAIVEESRKVKSYTSQFISDIQARKEQFQGRKTALKSEISQSQRKAIRSRSSRAEFKKQVEPIHKSIDALGEQLSQLFDSFIERMRSCASSQSCEKLNLEFNEKFNDILLDFEDIVGDFAEVNIQFSGDNTMIELRNSILNDISTKRHQHSQTAFKLYEEAANSVAQYKSMHPNPSGSNNMQKKYTLKSHIELAQRNIDDIFNEMQTKTLSAETEDKLQAIAADVTIKFWNIDHKLKEYKCRMEE